MCSINSPHRNDGPLITLNTGSETIYPVQCEKLLGAMVSDDFTWNAHIRDVDSSLFRTLVCRVNALAKISSSASFKTRKMIANGIVMSKLVYLIQVWGGCHNYLIHALQLVQNRAARLVTQLNRYTSVNKLLQQCGWLSVHQLVQYHILLLVYQVKHEKKPTYFSDKLNLEFNRETRLATSGGIRRCGTNKFSRTQSGFISKGSQYWNVLPFEIRQSKSKTSFKVKINEWIRRNVPLHS